MIRPWTVLVEVPWRFTRPVTAEVPPRYVVLVSTTQKALKQPVDHLDVEVAMNPVSASKGLAASQHAIAAGEVDAFVRAHLGIGRMTHALSSLAVN